MPVAVLLSIRGMVACMAICMAAAVPLPYTHCLPFSFCQVTDTTTFTDDKRRAEVDSWLYDTCTRTLQHIVDIVVQYYAAVSGWWVGLGGGE